MSYTPTTWVDNGPPAINAVNLQHMETGIDELDGRFGSGAAGVVRQPFATLHTIDAAATGAADKVGHVLTTVFTGNYGTSTGSNAEYGFGIDVFTVTGTSAGDATGGRIVNVIETAVRAPSGTLAQVTGLIAEASFFGATAGATASTMASLRVANPTRKDGATAGTATTVYGLHVEAVTASDVGATTAYSLFVAGGETHFEGIVTLRVASEAYVGDSLTVTAGNSQVGYLFRGDRSDGGQIFRVTTGGLLTAAGRGVFKESLASQVGAGDLGPSSQAAISFGSSSDTTLWRVAAGVFGFASASVPADNTLSAGQLAFYYDGTAGAAKLKLKGKNASGTVVTGEVALT